MQFKFDESRLIRHGLIMASSMIFARFFGYLFQIYVARALGPEEYGVFGSLFALFMILTIPVGTIDTVISRYTSDYKVKGDKHKIKILMLSAFKRLSKAGAIGFIVLAIFSIPLASFLKIESSVPIIIVGLTLFFTFISPIFKGVLKGVQMFNWLSVIYVSETFSKLVFGILLISLGFGLNGAVMAFSLGYLVPLLICFVPLRHLLRIKGENENIDFSVIYKYSVLVLIAIGTLNLVQNIDVILVKHLFTSYEAGIYTAMSNIGKIIFFLSAGISASMFPKVSELRSDSSASLDLLKKGVLSISLLSILFVIGCFLFDELIVRLLFGLEYVEGAFLLPYFSVALSFLSMTSIVVFYLLAKRDFNFLPIFIPIPILQVVFIYLFHEKLIDVVLILNVFFLISFGLVSFYALSKIKGGSKDQTRKN